MREEVISVRKNWEAGRSSERRGEVGGVCGFGGTGRRAGFVVGKLREYKNKRLENEKSKL